MLTAKLLDKQMLEYVAGGGRATVDLGVRLPEEGARGPVTTPIAAIPFGKALLRRDGDDVTLVSVGVGVHRALAAGDILAAEGIEAGVLDLRTVAPLDTAAIVEQARRTGRVVVVDEDYRRGDCPARLPHCCWRSAPARRTRGSRSSRRSPSPPSAGAGRQRAAWTSRVAARWTLLNSEAGRGSAL